jgi:hypothetical protein
VGSPRSRPEWPPGGEGQQVKDLEFPEQSKQEALFQILNLAMASLELSIGLQNNFPAGRSVRLRFEKSAVQIFTLAVKIQECLNDSPLGMPAQIPFDRLRGVGEKRGATRQEKHIVVREKGGFPNDEIDPQTLQKRLDGLRTKKKKVFVSLHLLQESVLRGEQFFITLLFRISGGLNDQHPILSQQTQTTA